LSAVDVSGRRWWFAVGVASGLTEIVDWRSPGANGDGRRR